jgi:hypothetical protein
VPACRRQPACSSPRRAKKARQVGAGGARTAPVCLWLSVAEAWIARRRPTGSSMWAAKRALIAEGRLFAPVLPGSCDDTGAAASRGAFNSSR